MAKKSKRASKKTTTTAKKRSQFQSKPKKSSFKQKILLPFKSFKKWRQNRLKRQPHRSFKLTYRRDYKRPLKLPSYYRLTKSVGGILWRNKRLFGSLLLFYIFLTLLFSSIMPQSTYNQIQEFMETANKDNVLGNILPLAVVSWSVLSDQLLSSSSVAIGSPQQIFGVLIGLFTWLATIWLVRQIYRGYKPKMRDGIYSSGGPVVAILLLLSLAVIQLLPAGLAVVIYAAADASGLISQSAALMFLGGVTFLAVTLSLYWMVSTIMALVIVTLPGVYPMQAVGYADEIVLGRRLRILMRLLWLLFLNVVLWFSVMMSTIVLDNYLKETFDWLSWLPLVQLTALALVACSIIFSATYIYVLHRKVAEDESPPV